MFLPHPRVKVSIVGSLRDREVACSASDHQGSNFESCVWRTVSPQSSHHPQEVLLAQFSLYVHKGGLKPDSFHLWKHRWSLVLDQTLQWQIPSTVLNPPVQTLTQYSRADQGSSRDRLDKSMKFDTVTPAILLINFRRVAQKSEWIFFVKIAFYVTMATQKTWTIKIGDSMHNK